MSKGIGIDYLEDHPTDRKLIRTPGGLEVPDCWVIVQLDHLLKKKRPSNSTLFELEIAAFIV